MKYKYLLFDADNTLFDFDKAEKKAFLALSQIDDKVFSSDNYDKYHKINDICWKKLERREITKDKLKSERFAELYRSLGLVCDDDIIKRITAQYPLNLALGSELTEGAVETVAYLSKKYKIYIITNGLAEVQTKRFTASEIYRYVDDMFISETVGYDKPDVRYFDYTLSRIGDADKRKYLVIGDSITSDIDGAINSGIDCILYDPKGKGTFCRKVNDVISHLSELKNIL